MKKMLTLITIAMIAFVTNAQVVVAEKDWTGCTESDLIWYMFGDGQEGSVTADPDGIAITIPELSGQIWLPQTIILDGATLEDDHSFIVRITAKIPSDGQLQVNMGNWSDNYQEQVNVKAADDFQDIDIEFTNYPFMCDEDAHIILRSGFIVGKTIIKKVQIIDKDASGDPVVPVSILYKYNADNKTAEVIKTSQGKYKGDITIPATVTYEGEVYTVTKIGDNAFYNCTNLTSVSIPNSVSSIGISAFYYCKRLSSLNIPNSVTSIESSTFDRCSSLESITIPDGVTSIGNDAFRECRGLKSVSIPNRVTSIGSSAFSSCSGLTSVTIGNSVTSIGGWAFNGCSGLTSVTIPSSITSIGESAFQNCNDLKEIISEIAEPCQLNENVFPLHIYSIAKLSVPDGTKATYSATEGWNKFSIIKDYDPRKLTINVATAGTLPTLIPADEKYLIEELALSGDLNGTDIHFIRDMAGINMDGMRYGDNEFWPGENSETKGQLRVLDMSDVNIVEGGRDYYRMLQSSVEGTFGDYKYTMTNTISDQMFSYCRKLEELILPRSVTSISATSIALEVNLKQFKVADGNPYYDSRNDCNAVIETASNKLILGSNNTIIPDGVTSIGSNAFSSCSSLSSITIPNSVTSIGYQSFYDCSSLTSITIPNSVTSIENKAFCWCNGLISVYIDIKEPLIIGMYTFTNRSNALLYVPKGCKAAYEAADYWKEFKEIKEFAKDEEVTCALEEDNTATVTAANDPTEKDVVIPESVIIGDESHPVTAIGENAFKNNTELALACIPETIDEIGDNAFAGCSNLKAIYCYNDEPIALGSDKATVRTRADGNETSATAVFADVDKTTCILYVPLNSANKYRTAEGWGEFENIVEMKSNILGDANNDGEVDDKDLEATSAYIMEGKTDSFIFKNADVKTDSRINAADIVKIVNLKK